MSKTVFLLLMMICSHVQSQEVYKWTDENGKVHFGDRSTAPLSGQKVEVKVPPRSGSPEDPADRAKAEAKKKQSEKAAAADPAKDPKCQRLVDGQSKLEIGSPQREARVKEIRDACPGLAYKCVWNKASPQDDKCWITP